MPNLLNQANRTGRIESPSAAVPANLTGKFLVMSNIAAADLADPLNWVQLNYEVQDGANWIPGGGVTFQCGPYAERDGTVLSGGKDRGFTVDSAEVSGKTIRGVIELRRGTIDPQAGVPEAFAALPFTTMRIGVTYTAG